MKSSICPDCENIYTDVQIENGKVVPCNRCYKCFVGDCGNINCECEFSDDECEESESESDDCCVLCGGPYTYTGNNPFPVEDHGVCCDDCNYLKVIPARFRESWKNYIAI
jgi:hypothetical protein